MYAIFALNVQKCVGFWGSAPDPAGGAYGAPPDPVVMRAFLPSAIAVSRLRRLIPISPPNKNTRPISPPKHKILEPPLFFLLLFLIFFLHFSISPFMHFSIA